MANPFLIDPNKIKLDQIVFGKDKLREINPHRYEMEQVDGILKLDIDQALTVAYRDIKPDEFWVRGHIPGRPLFPGVLMIESAAQVGAFYTGYMIQQGKLVLPRPDMFVGFGGVADVKFRGIVVPGDKLIILCKCLELRPRRAVFQTQGVVNNKLVFEAKIIGMPV